MTIPVYGNAYPGDHPAIFTGVSEANLGKGFRLLFGFLILRDDRQAPATNNAGEDLYAVAVCNKSEGKNPKSKPRKICKAMLRDDEFDAVTAAAKLTRSPTEF